MVGEKKEEKKINKKKRSRCTWVVRKKMKEKRKRIGGGDIQRVERESDKENGKCRYFGSCEKNK